MYTRRNWIKTLGLSGLAIPFLGSGVLAATKVVNNPAKVVNNPAKVVKTYNCMGVETIHYKFGWPQFNYVITSSNELDPTLSGTYFTLSQLRHSMRIHNIDRCVISRDPEFPEIQQFAKDFDGKVALCRFRDFGGGRFITTFTKDGNSMVANSSYWKQETKLDSYLAIAQRLTQ